MPSGLYPISIPVIARLITNLDGVLAKGAAYLKERGLPESVLLDFRLFPDMFPLTSQVQTVSDVSKGAVARLGNVDIPKFEDNEKSFADLKARLEKTLVFIRSIDHATIDASAERSISLVGRDRTMNFSGLDYLTAFVLPNLYFHSSIAYAILRHNGVPLGKRDFLGPV